MVEIDANVVPATPERFKISFAESLSLRSVVRQVVEGVGDTETTAPGALSRETTLMHLVGATLDCELGKERVRRAQSAGNGKGDFFFDHTAVHVAAGVSESLIRSCLSNLNAGLRPIVITLQPALLEVEGSLNDDRFDILEIEQFVALSLYRTGKFERSGWRAAMANVVTRYNEIVQNCGSNPDLRIDFSLMS